MWIFGFEFDILEFFLNVILVILFFEEVCCNVDFMDWEVIKLIFVKNIWFDIVVLLNFCIVIYIMIMMENEEIVNN